MGGHGYYSNSSLKLHPCFETLKSRCFEKRNNFYLIILAQKSKIKLVC